MADTLWRGKYPVVWDESSWEREQWRPQETFRPVFKLIEEVANDHDRRHLMEDQVPSPQDNSVQFAVDAEGRLSLGDIKTSDRRAVVLTHAILRAVRELNREETARIIRQVDVPDQNGVVQRTVVVRRDRQTLTTTDQIKRLDRAVRSRSQFKIEQAWFGLTERAHEYLSVGFHIARRHGALAEFRGELEQPATIIRAQMLSIDLLKVILPYAIRAVTLPGRRPEHPRDEALAKIFAIFVEASGRTSTSARRGDRNEPAGPGADFVRAIEAIFKVRLMAERSTHSVARAKKRMSDARN